MTTSKEFLKAGVTGQTFREITEKFGRNFNRLSEEDELMANYALGFAWLREREHLPVPEAYTKALGLTIGQIMDYFEDPEIPEVAVNADFVSQPPTTTP